jgi:Dcp1-like decapping family
MYRIPKQPDDRKKAQLSFFKETDPSVTDILVTASHCAVYTLQTMGDSKHAWHKSDIEGSLYVLKRSNKPFLSFIIRNQNGGEDFIESIVDKVNLEIKDQTVFYKIGDKGKVHGLWFSNQDSLQKFVKCMQSAPIEDPGKTLMSLIKKEQPSASAPIAPPAIAPSVPSAPAISPKPAMTVIPPPPGLVVNDDSLSILRSRLEIPQQMSQQITQQVSAVLPEQILVTRADLRIVLADLVSSDAFINEIYNRLINRNNK